MRTKHTPNEIIEKERDLCYYESLGGKVNLTEEKLLRTIADAIERQKHKEANKNFKINAANVAKFETVCRGLLELKGEIVLCNTTPQAKHADISVAMQCIDLYGESLKRFKSILEAADVVGIMPTADGKIQIDISVNNLWELSK